MQWGVMYFGNLVINGRFEELTEKRLFQDIVHTQRCVVIFDGYYEWKQNAAGSTNKKGTVPYFIKMK